MGVYHRTPVVAKKGMGVKGGLVGSLIGVGEGLLIILKIYNIWFGAEFAYIAWQ